jgi:hypothetical protein
MSFVLFLTLLAAPVLPLGAQDTNPETPLSRHSYPCSLAERSCSNDFVLDLLPDDRRGTSRQWMIWLDTTVFYDSQNRLTYAGTLEWTVQVWNGRTWEPESHFLSAPWNRENSTAVLVSKSTRVRVKVKLAEGFRPPTVDIPINAFTRLDPAS